MAWVVLNGIPRREAVSMTAAAPLSAANPLTGLILTIRTPRVLITRQPPAYVPAAITVPDRKMTHRGM